MDFALGLTRLRQCIGESIVEVSFGTRTKPGDCVCVELFFRPLQSYKSYVSVFVYTCIMWTDINIIL